MLAIVTGLIGSYPLGGMTFHYIQYALGLKALGFDVVYLEDTGKWVYDPVASTFSEDPGHAVAYLDATMRRFGLPESWCFRDPRGDWHGAAADRISALLARADVLLNVSGSCWLRPEYRDCRNLVYIDTDPGYTQFKVRQAASDTADDAVRRFVECVTAHDHYATFAANIGRDGCEIPLDSLDWIPTRQPIVLDLWPVVPAETPVRFSTVLSWTPYGRWFRHGHATFWGKQREMMKVLELPRRTKAQFEVALSGEGPEGELRERGWNVVPAASVSSSPEAYQRYIASSGAEFSVAKDMYVDTRSGWFSERTACYLASGRPAVVQDTGFTAWLPRSAGVHAFRDVDEAAECVHRVETSFGDECAQARAIAETYFDASRVLGELLAAVGL